MTFEKQLIDKTYYYAYLEGNEGLHPVRVLGDMYRAEQQREVPDLTMIRFAQGEIYFHNKDFEAAIFKWENITNEFEPWAKKNMADAYFEIDLLSTAEDIYKAIQTESESLKIEILLQLFSLYIQRGKLEMAVAAIKDAVSLNPDYPDVTEIARLFFEEHQDWRNAVELAVKEAIRTKSMFWYEVLQIYVEQGHTTKVEPSYFSEALKILSKVDHARFESLSSAFWNNYKQKDLYFPWLKEFNHLLLHIEKDRSNGWHELSDLYQEAYLDLIAGKYLIREIDHLLPAHLTNWLKIASSSHAQIAAASVLAWSEIFPSNIDSSAISEAETLILQVDRHGHGLEDGYLLFETVMKWAKKNGVLMGERYEWLVRELLDLDVSHLLVVGAEGNGQSTFIQSLIGEQGRGELPPAVVMFKDSEVETITEITDEHARTVDNIFDLEEGWANNQDTLIDYRKSFPYLSEAGIALIDTPKISGDYKSRNNVLQYLSFADNLLFVLNADTSFSDKELDMVVRIREQVPNLQVDFLLNRMDRIQNEQEAIELIEKTASRVNTYFPNAKIFAFSALDSGGRQLYELSVFLQDMMAGRNLEEERTEKMLYTIRKSLKFLFEKRIEMENRLMDTIKWNEEMVIKLNGVINQLNDTEEEKIKVIKRAYTQIKDEMRKKLTAKIPELLRNCSELIKEDSDFGKIHIMLNQEMNKRIQDFIEQTVLVDFHLGIGAWIAESEEEFNQSQQYLNEMSDSFNELYGIEKLELTCDFKVLDDWRRDADRMTRGGVQLEPVNILLRFTPSQFLLKSAGKLFGALSQNKTMIHDRYKQFVESEDYGEIADKIGEKFTMQFELFEKALDRDIKMFFKNPLDILGNTVVETKQNIETNKEALSEMRKNPEIYRDPLTLFDLRLRQYKWMTSERKREEQYL